MKKILQAMDGIATKPVEGSDSMKKFLQVVTEGANPHKVTLPVQMAMQHYQKQETTPVVKKDTVIGKYFQQVEEATLEEQAHRKQLLRQYAQKISQRVLENRYRSRDPYRDDVAASQSGFGRQDDHRGLKGELADETNNIAIAINGKTWKVIPGRGYADSPEEYKYLQHMKDWAAKKSATSGKKWSVHLTGAEPTTN
jgi:ClpP class serine protease